MQNFDYACEYARNIWKKEVKNDSRLSKKKEHSERVAKYLVLLSGKQEYEFYGLIHDIGRIEQLKKINNFDDKQYNHALAGIDYINNNNLEFLKNFEKAQDAIQYHSNYTLLPKEKECEMLTLLTLADQLDNAITCKGYLEYEESIDNKGYIKDKTDKPELTNYFIQAIVNKDYLIDKKHCETYLDYFYFAYTLLIRVINNPIFKGIKIDKEIKYDLLDSFNFFERLFKERLNGKSILENIIKDMQEYKSNFLIGE